MKKLIGAAVMLASLALVSGASADVTGLAVRFKGGCSLANTAGNCTIGVTASGTDLDTEAVRIYHSDTRTGSFIPISTRNISLDANGRATKRFKNAAGCYRARTAPNGNDKPDKTSRIICEE